MAFGFESSADEVLAGVDLSGVVAMVTGASAGLGSETARALAARGASVTLLGRSLEKLSAVSERIGAETGRKPEVGQVDLSRPASVREVAEVWLSRHDTLDLLINNAGIMAPPLTRTEEGWEIQFATNHLGHFLLTNLLTPALQRAGKSRVVNVSSAGHWMGVVDFSDVHYERRTYDPFNAYGQSKTANVWFALELNRRGAPHGLASFSVHPGGILTELGRNLDPKAKEAVEKMLSDPNLRLKTIPQGAATTCWAATSAKLEEHGGSYLEDCHVSLPGESAQTGGHAPHAYDQAAAERLWALSNEHLGTDF